ncbi:XdhC family aldehyde oxidoreductase maturation factor [Fusibacter sp. 3D3]|uniref:XdhC family aldehyde oxidoreductase maturation factor n=1 Tax=Fusibacter sp. 3D3 TaxID=1048380 RepID=UPI000852E8ED|nr:XdhC/CoxI family protein [Fusibacter sp. 3D3]GAU77645.1 xanthine and CO dehydrogenases maturation factor [Fusibacter sp. 3D3]
MNSIWHSLKKILEAKEDCVLATIIDKSGSAPRSFGAHMIICDNMSIIGTIGGGKLEAVTMETARAVFKQKRSLIQSFSLTGEEASETDMICGGAGEILLDYISADEASNLEVVNALIACLKKREKAWLCTIINQNGDRQQCLVEAKGCVTGELKGEGEFYKRMISNPAKVILHSERFECKRVVIEPIQSGGYLYVFGAGHVSQKLVGVAEKVGFDSIVIDDRPEFLNAERFPNVTLILVSSLEEPLPKLPYDRDSYMVIVTRGHMHDKTILDQVLHVPSAYIGMIGSRHKRDLIYKDLIEQKGYRSEAFSNVHCPIGLEIFAESPEEIAVSIVAELIKVRAQNTNES